MQRSIYKINPYTCDGCGRCVFECDNNAIIADSLGFYIDESLCDDCGDCISTCISNAIFVRDGRVRISGTIFSSSTSFYISGAVITIDSVTVNTDRFGNYYHELNPGIYNITFSAVGYQDSVITSQPFEGDGCYQYNITLNDENTKVNNVSKYTETEIRVSPNPFNPETNIEYSIETNSHVIICVYNMKGQKIVTLLNKQVQAGKHNIVWNGRNQNGKSLSSGTYMISMSVGNQVKTVKAVLLK